MKPFRRQLLANAISHVTRNRQGQSKSPAMKQALGGLVSLSAIDAMAADVHNISADANFTTVTTTGNTHLVQSTKTSGSVSVNVFDDFVVGSGNTVNMEVPTTSDQLVNIVRDTKPEIHGTLNSYVGAYADGNLGGDVLFASSEGFLVGPTGIVNVGKLTVRTPTSSEISGLISNGTDVDASNLADLRSGNISLSDSGLVQIQGKINTSSGVEIQADAIEVSSTGTVIVGSAYQGVYGTLAAVNTGDYSAVTDLKADGGTIVLAASEEQDSNNNAYITIDGDLLADGGITITAEEVTISSTGLLDTRDADTTDTSGDVSITVSESESVYYGEAIADTSISISGEIQANNVTASATSKTVSSFYEDIGATIGLKSVAQLGGVDFNYMDADSDATVEVLDGANITASGNVTLSTESHAMTEAMAVAALGDATTVSMAGIYNHSSADSTTKVHDGATVNAEGDLTVTAHNEAYVSASAFVLNAEKANNAVLAGAVGEADVNATAIVETGATIDGTNVTVAAENQGRYYVSATTYGLKDTRYGMAVAVGDFDTNATAEFGADLGESAVDGDKATNLVVAAIDRTVEQRVHSGVTVGSNLIARTIGSQLVSGLTSVQSGTTSLLNRYNASGESPASVDFKGGLSFSLNLSDHEAYAAIGTNVDGATDAPKIYATGDVVAVASTALGTDNEAVANGSDSGAVGGDQGGYRTSAETSVVAPSENTSGGNQTPRSETSLALALNLAVNESDAVAEIGDYVTIEAENVGVFAEQTLPIVSTYDRWEGFGDVVSKFNGVGGIQNNILTTFANAGAAADKEAYGGSLNVVVNDMDTKAWIGDGAYVKTTGTGAWTLDHEVEGNSNTPGLTSSYSPFKNIDYSFSFDAPLSVQAYNLIESAHVAGNIGSLGLLPNGNGTNEQGKAVGASISFIQQTGSVVAGAGDASLISAGDINISAVTEERHFLVTPSSGMGSGFGFNGVAGILNSETLTHASLSNDAFVNTDGLNVLANHEMGNWAAAGAVNWSDEESVGIAIAINLTQGDTKAFIGDNEDEYDKVDSKRIICRRRHLQQLLRQAKLQSRLETWLYVLRQAVLMVRWPLLVLLRQNRQTSRALEISLRIHGMAYQVSLQRIIPNHHRDLVTARPVAQLAQAVMMIQPVVIVLLRLIPPTGLQQAVSMLPSVTSMQKH